MKKLLLVTTLLAALACGTSQLFAETYVPTCKDDCLSQRQACLQNNPASYCVFQYQMCVSECF